MFYFETQPWIAVSAYLRSEISLSMKLITLELKTKLENTVNSPAIPATKYYRISFQEIRTSLTPDA